MSKISIITPTFNRSSFLNDIYLKLIQYERDIFEWIIIDDGSTDETKDLVKNFENKFPIKYHYQSNSGKHVAVNKGMDLVTNEYTVILDSDDLPLPNAFYTIITLFNKIGNNIVGIAVNMCDSRGNVFGKYNLNPFTDTIYNAYQTNKVDGDKWIIWKSNFIKKYKFPIFDNEKFVPEGLLYNRISRNGYMITFFPDILLNARYQLDGYSNNIQKLKFNNFNGFMNYYCENVYSENLVINNNNIKSVINIIILILNKSKRPFILFLIILISMPLILLIAIFARNKYFNPQK